MQCTDRYADKTPTHIKKEENDNKTLSVKSETRIGRLRRESLLFGNHFPRNLQGISSRVPFASSHKKASI